MDNSTNLSDRQQQQQQQQLLQRRQPQHYNNNDNLRYGIGSFGTRSEPSAHLHRQQLLHQKQQQQQQQQQQQNFLLSVLLLQKELQQKQQQRQEQQQQQQRQQHARNNNPLTRGFPGQPLSATHLHSSPFPQHFCFPSITTNNNNNTSHAPSPLSVPSPPEQQQQQEQQQCQEQQNEVRIWTEAVESLIRNAESRRKQKLACLEVVSVRIERESLEQPWGLGFVSTTTNHQHSCHHKKFETTSCNNDNNHHNHHHHHHHRVRTATKNLLYGKRIIVVRSSSARIGGQRDERTKILPGDMLLAVDGKAVSSWGAAKGNNNADAENNNTTTTGEIASFLRSVRKTSIVVLRHSEARNAALSWNASCSTSSTSTTTSTPLPHDPYRICSVANASWNNLLFPHPSLPKKPKPTTKAKAKQPPKQPIVYRNPWFWRIDQEGKKVNIPYEDNEGSLDYELYRQQESSRVALFLPSIPSERTEFCEDWLTERKKSWKTRYKVYKLASEAKKPKKKQRESKPKAIQKEGENDEDCFGVVTTNADFWTHQGFFSFDDWLRTRSIQWHRSYSWNKRKRQKIEAECFEKVVFLPLTHHHHHNPNNHHSSSPVCSTDEFNEWLTARRVQWKMSRRKRKRQRLSMEAGESGSGGGRNDPSSSAVDKSKKFLPAIGCFDSSSSSPSCVSSFPSQATNGTSAASSRGKPFAKRKLQFLSGRREDQQMAFIDEILEEKERERQEILRKRAERPPIDILRFFDATKGIPDDVVAHCVAYINPREHGKLLNINRAVSKALRERHGVWQMLCPAHWILPRRPRKPWHEIYLTRLRKEHELHQKRWDDLLIKCSSALFKRDDLQKIEKLITRAEKEFGFDLNYSSGVVCERNSVLNLAVIHGRYKVVRWLVDTKHADIETADRGNFTPLLNAAWSGDRWLVRFFLQRQANRMVRGTQHYTKGIAPPGFEGKTAEGWAEHRGHAEIAKLIQLGL